MAEFAKSLDFKGLASAVADGGTSMCRAINQAYLDAGLIEELPGYRDYAQRVRYRLIPGIY